MVSLKLQKRLASSVLKCGKNRVWLDPNESSELSLATTRRSIRKLVKNNIILKREVAMHSRARVRKYLEAKRKGRHTGYGKRKGTREARMPTKILWIRRQRTLRRLLSKYKSQKKIDKKLYHKFYLACKGNAYKNKKTLIESIHKEKNEKVRLEKIENEQQARRNKNLEKRKRKLEAKVRRQEA